MSGGGATAIFVGSRDARQVSRLDPRIRLSAALLFIIVLVFLRSPLSLIAAVAVGVGTAIWAQPPLRPTLRRLAEVEGFLVLLLASLPFTVPGMTLFSVFGFPASLEGLGRAAMIVARVNAAVLVIAGLLSTMGTAHFAGAMAGIGIPDKIAHLFQLTVRYISVFRDEYSRLRRAMQARAFRAGSNWHSWRTLGNLVGMLLVRSMERAERVSRAMRCRGFSGTSAPFEHGRLALHDAAFFALWTVGMIVLAIIEAVR